MPKKNKVLFDKDLLDSLDNSINMAVPWYLMAAYAYYVEDNPILEDHTFDRLAKKMLDHWDEIEHMHKFHITKDSLAAGTFLGDYPTRIRGAVSALRGK